MPARPHVTPVYFPLSEVVQGRSGGIVGAIVRLGSQSRTKLDPPTNTYLTTLPEILNVSVDFFALVLYIALVNSLVIAEIVENISFAAGEPLRIIARE